LQYTRNSPEQIETFESPDFKEMACQKKLALVIELNKALH